MTLPIIEATWTDVTPKNYKYCAQSGNIAAGLVCGVFILMFFGGG